MAEVVTLWGVRGGSPAGVTIPVMIQGGPFDIADIANYAGTNGEALATGSSKTVTNPADFVLTDTGAFTGLTLDALYIYISTGASAVGWYEIISHTDDAVTFDGTAIDGGAAVIGTTDHTYTIGGIGEIDDPDVDDKFQALLDLMGASIGSANNLDILLNQSFTVDQSIDIDNIGATITTRHRLIGMNSSFIDDGTQVTIATVTNLASGLLVLDTLADHIVFRNLDLDGGNKTDDAVYCLNGGAVASTGAGTTYVNCSFHGASSSGVRARSSSMTLVDCDIYDNGLYGFEAVATIISLVLNRCDIHDNTNHGIHARFSAGSFILNCQIYDNGGAGISGSSSTTDVQLSDNVIYGNTGDGMVLPSSYARIKFFNNTISGHATANGINLNGANVSGMAIFSNNHSHGNNQHTDTVSADADWIALGDGNNIIGDPKFTSVVDGSENFIPQVDSLLIDAGIIGTGDTIGAWCATAGGGTGGGLITHPGMAGGMRG